MSDDHRLVVTRGTPSLYDWTLYDWTGFYFGGHVGYTRGNAQVTLADPMPIDFTSSFGSLTGGVQLGYNYLLPSRLLLGVEADVSFLDALAANDVAWSRLTAAADIAEKVDYMATVRARLGYAFPRWMIYVTGGPALSLGRYLANPGVTDNVDKLLHLHVGWAVGVGAEAAIARSWTARFEYLYRDFGRAAVLFPSGTSAASAFDAHSFRVGLNYKLGAAGKSSNAKGSTPSQPEFPSWEIHGQTTYIQQGYPAFRSPYLGDNSLTPWSPDAQDLDERAFLGLGYGRGASSTTIPSCFRALVWHNTTGAGGLSQRRSAEVEFRLSALQHLAFFPAPDIRAWR